MTRLSPATLELLRDDVDAREGRLREIVQDRLAEFPPPLIDDQIVATYFLVLRSWTLSEAGSQIQYHATSGTHDPPPGSLLAACTGEVVRVDPFDAARHIGLLHMAFPLKMMLQPDGHVTSCDLLHTVAGAILFDVYEMQDARLVQLGIPERVLRTFPGPALGSTGVRCQTGFARHEPAFGTILKPTAGLTPPQVGRLVEEAARCPLFLFVKEDENLYPHLDYSPVKDRVRAAVASIDRAREARRGRGLIFAPHVSGAPHEILETVHAVLDAGATGLMFSETFAGGTVRMVREATKSLPHPPALYGHNAGIGVKTRCIWRELTDLLARLDGIDFRQTAPVLPGPPFLRPFGKEWEASEEILRRPLPGIKPTMLVRAGGLDQGNIGLNLADVERQGIGEHVLFLAGSAINSVKNSRGQSDPQLGAEAMQQALDVHQSGELCDVGPERHVTVLLEIARRSRRHALVQALQQRYAGLASC